MGIIRTPGDTSGSSRKGLVRIRTENADFGPDSDSQTPVRTETVRNCGNTVTGQLVVVSFLKAVCSSLDNMDFLNQPVTSMGGGY